MNANGASWPVKLDNQDIVITVQNIFKKCTQVKSRNSHYIF